LPTASLANVFDLDVIKDILVLEEIGRKIFVLP
jgi:hypothetical protein